MAKFYGEIGFGITEETEPQSGIWESKIVKRRYTGDIYQYTRRYESSGETVNDNVSVSNDISIVGDQYAISHLGEIKFIDWLGTKWSVKSITVLYPRITISLGGVYNGPTD